MSDGEEFEPVRFPMEKNIEVNIARYRNLVNIYYDMDGEELNLSLNPADAIQFAELLKIVANEIIDEEKKNGA